MFSHTPLAPCPTGRQMAAALASMHVRPVLHPTWGLIYLSVAPPTRTPVRPLLHPSLGVIFVGAAPRKTAPVRSAVPARYQPRDASGQFVSFAEVRDAINLEYAMTSFDCDQSEFDVFEQDVNEHDCPGCDEFDDCDPGLPW